VQRVSVQWFFQALEYTPRQEKTTHVMKAHSIMSDIPATKPVCLMANGIPTIPLPTMQDIILAEHPMRPDLCSLTISGPAMAVPPLPPCFVLREATTTWGVEGLKNGERGASCIEETLLAGVMVVTALVLCAGVLSRDVPNGYLQWIYIKSVN